MPSTFIQDRIIQARAVGYTVSDSLDVGMVVKYIGTQASGLVTVNSARSLVFTVGAVGAEAADTTIGAPTLNGTIDVTDASANNFGKIVDLINASAGWQAYLVDVLRSDNSNASTGSLLNMTATQAKVAGGIQLLKDTTKVLNLSKVLRGLNFPDDSAKKDTDNRVKALLEKGKWSEVLKLTSNNTFASGTNLIQIFSIDRLSGTSTKIFSRNGGATTVDQALDLTDGAGRGLACPPDANLLVRMVGSGFCTGFLSIQGKVI